MKKFVISEKCNGCGICTASTNLIAENSKGIVYATKNCFISNDFLAEAKKIEASCPVGAISIAECGNTKLSGKAGLKELHNALKTKLTEITLPPVKIEDIKFDATNYSIDYGSDLGAYKYNYSSDSQAERAAISAFDRIAYSQYRPFILSVFVQYKNDKLKPFYTFDENSFYGQCNKMFEAILSEISAEAIEISGNKIALPDDFSSFEFLPGYKSPLSRSESVYGVANFEKQSTSSGIMEEFHKSSYSSLDSYKMYIETDDMTDYSGTDWRGRTKETTKYCYKMIYEAVNEYIKDLKSAMNYVDIDESALYFVECAISAYKSSIDIAIKEKLEQFEQAIAKL